MTGEREALGVHHLVNPPTLPAAVGFSHAVVAGPGRTIYVGGQAGHRPDGTLVGNGLVEQFDQACANVVAALRAVDGRPQHIVSMHIFVTDGEGYRSSLGEIGRAYRRHFGRHYPAIALFEVSGLFDPEAKVELTCVAVLPDRGPHQPTAPLNLDRAPGR
jgi:enamine deaminase RidA (YjgF/YER057c/UK114 family)